MNTKDIGNLGEHIAIVELLNNNIQVSRPLGDNSRYDLILDVNSNLYTCQVKSSVSATSDKVNFTLQSSQNHRNNGRKYYEVDLFILVDIINNKVFMLLNTEERSSITFRYTEVPYQGGTRINNANDFLLTKIINSL